MNVPEIKGLKFIICDTFKNNIYGYYLLMYPNNYNADVLLSIDKNGKLSYIEYLSPIIYKYILRKYGISI